jgi:hypothetical protein
MEKEGYELYLDAFIQLKTIELYKDLSTWELKIWEERNERN